MSIPFPILYLSEYIIQNKTAYYKALKDVTENNDWPTWILYILDAVESTARNTLNTIKQIFIAQKDTIAIIKKEAPEIYSKELVELLYEQPYCKISFLVNRGLGHRQTASKYLDRLCAIGILNCVKKGREKYYINIQLWDILTHK